MSYCCDMFRDAVDEGLFLEAEVAHAAQWYMAEGPHVYYCPFCGTDIRKNG